MKTDLQKAIRDYAVSSIALFFASAYSQLNPQDLLSNLNYNVLYNACVAGINALWIAIPTTVGLFFHRKIRPTQEQGEKPLY